MEMMDTVINDHHHKPIYFPNFRTMSYGALQSKLNSMKDFILVRYGTVPYYNKSLNTYVRQYSTIPLSNTGSKHFTVRLFYQMYIICPYVGIHNHTTVLGESFHPHFF